MWENHRLKKCRLGFQGDSSLECTCWWLNQPSLKICLSYTRQIGKLSMSISPMKIGVKVPWKFPKKSKSNTTTYKFTDWPTPFWPPFFSQKMVESKPDFQGKHQPMEVSTPTLHGIHHTPALSQPRCFWSIKKPPGFGMDGIAGWCPVFFFGSCPTRDVDEINITRDGEKHTHLAIWNATLSCNAAKKTRLRQSSGMTAANESHVDVM